jgi:NAD(P)-dependent dehydrogenase (short-subunit alcohol dehydrogenase family)
MSNQILVGKVAVITGSSRGIGKAIALELASNGASIVLNGRNPGKLIEAESEIQNIQNKVISVCCDVSTIEGGKQLIDESIKQFGRIDILVNNVGISMRGKLADINPEVFKKVLESNILGIVYPTIPSIRYLRETKGSLIFISSLAGIRGLPGLSAYCSSKMALRALAETIRLEESKNDLHVGLILVGYTENDEGKETMNSDGSKILLAPRKGKGVQTKQSVAKSVLSNIIKRKFITVLTGIGKLNIFLQSGFPMLVERVLLRNIKKFEDHLK